MQREARRLAVQSLSDVAFERLVHDLFVRERAEGGVQLRKLRPPDHGGDSLVYRSGSIEEVIQAKRFTGKPDWGQCEESLDRAVEAWSPSRVTFVFALDFHGEQQKTFDRRIAGRHDEIEVIALTLTDIDHLLDEHPQVATRHLGPDAADMTAAVERASRLGGQRLATGRDLFARAKELGRFGDEMDSRFAYSQSSGSLECPKPRFDELPYMTIQRVGERERVEVSVWPRPDTEAEIPGVVFTEDEAGREALAKAREGLARGEAVTLRDGVRLALRTAPKLVEELIEEGWEAYAGTLRPSHPLELHVEVLGPTGPVERRFAVYVVPPRSGEHPSFASSADSLWFELTLEPLEEPQVALHVRCSVRPTTDFDDNASAAAFALALIDAERITFRCPALLPEEGLSTDQGMGSEAQRDAFTFLRDFHGDLDLIERALDISLDLPEELPRIELDTVGTVAEVLRTGGGSVTVQEVTNVVSADQLAHLAETVEDYAKREQSTYTVFGRVLDLGLAEYDLPRMRIAGIYPHGDTPGAPARVVYKPEGTDQAPFRLVDEQERSPEITSTAGGAVLLG